MIIKIILLLLSTSALAVENDKPDLTTTEKVVLFGGLGVAAVGGAVIAGPYVLSAGTIAAIKAAAVTAVAKVAAVGAAAKATIAALPVAAQVSIGLSAAHMAAQTARPHVLPNEQEKCAENIKEEITKTQEAKAAYVSCMRQHKLHPDKDEDGRPLMCQEVARIFGLIVGLQELDKTTNSIIH
jgi:hypothetical protein